MTLQKIIKREKAVLLRKKGLNIRDIAEKLDVSKSSVSNWCRDIALTQKQIQQLEKKRKDGQHRGSMIAAERKRALRKKRVKETRALGATDIGRLSKRDLYMLGLGLYWGEGYKSDNGELGFTNSDSGLISVYIQWLNQIYGVTKKELIFRVGINAIHKERESEVLAYWTQILSVPLGQFTKTSFIKSKTKKKYGNMHTHYGTLRVKVRRGTNLQRRILGSIEHLGTLF